VCQFHCQGFVGKQRCITPCIVFHYCFKKAKYIVFGFLRCIAYLFKRAAFLPSRIALNFMAAGMK
jgi:hypothetical protein